MYKVGRGDGFEIADRHSGEFNSDAGHLRTHEKYFGVRGFCVKCSSNNGILREDLRLFLRRRKY